MEITLQNYKSVLSPELLAKAKKGTVRECDEIEAGHYQAYVDEADQTYDTSLVFNKKKELTSHGCDCESVSPFCHHKASLLLFVANGQKVTAKLKGGKKASDLESLVNGADIEKLKAWLIKLLTENKDLGMNFSQHFAYANKQYEPAEIKKLTLEAIKAIIKTKRTIDSTNGKRIIELWAVLHEPIVNTFCAQLASEASFLNVHAIMEACDVVLEKFGTLYNRLGKYQEKLLSSILNPLVQLKDEVLWDLVTERFVYSMVGEPYYLRIYYLNFLSQLYQICSPERKKRLAFMLITQYMQLETQSYYDSTKYTIAVFNIVADSGLFPDHYMLFAPIRFQYQYNLTLIELLMEIEMYALAEKYCLEQIDANSNAQYNEGYLAYLRAIYELQKDDKKLADVLMAGFSYDYDFDNYLFIETVIGKGEELIKWRNQLIAKARREAGQNIYAVLFAFQILEHEKKYAKMFDYLDECVNYEVMARFGEIMAANNLEKFFKIVLYRHDHFSDYYQEDASSLMQSLEKLFNIFFKYYDFATLRLILNDRMKNARFHPINQFIVFLNDKLSAM